MANSIATVSRRLYRSLLSNASNKISQISRPFCTNNHIDDSDERDESADITSDLESSADSLLQQQRTVYDRPLENGLDVGVYKAILVGQVGQTPLQKKLKSGKSVTLFSVGTGGIRNNRRPLENEEAREYANRCAVQWHRVSIYPERLGEIVVKNVLPGSIVYLEGNLETKIFTDPVTGIVRRIREIAIRRNGRVVFLGKAGEIQQPSPGELKGVGYY